MLTTERFFLPVIGLRPGAVGLGKPDDVFVFFVTVLPLNLALEDAFLVAVVVFVVEVLLT